MGFVEDKLASRAGLWYNRRVNVVAPALLAIAQGMSQFCLGELTMDTISSCPQDNNPPEKTCKGPCGRTLPATTEYFYRNGKVLYSQCKECKSKKTKIHNSQPEVQKRRNERYKGYWQDYKERPEAQERISTYQQAYRQISENQEKKREYLQDYRAVPENQDRHREWTRIYREDPEVRERMNERERTRYANSPKMKEQARNKVNNRVARKKSALGTHTIQEIQDQHKRQKGKCYYCHQDVKWGKHHVDHVVPLSRGGSNDISNLVIACASCNLSKSDKLPHEWEKGGRLL